MKIKVKTNECRHRKLIAAFAYHVGFTPDQEPYVPGVEESCGIEEISVGSFLINYCPICEVIKTCEPDDVRHAAT